jgi:aspartate/methionine/tyrosine aminotransferase
MRCDGPFRGDVFGVFGPCSWMAGDRHRPRADGIPFCLGLPERCGVVAVPTAVFYDDPDAGRSHVRFAFCKREDVLREAASRLRQL